MTCQLSMYETNLHIWCSAIQPGPMTVLDWPRTRTSNGLCVKTSQVREVKKFMCTIVDTWTQKVCSFIDRFAWSHVAMSKQLLHGYCETLFIDILNQYCKLREPSFQIGKPPFYPHETNKLGLWLLMYMNVNQNATGKLFSPLIQWSDT